MSELTIKDMLKDLKERQSEKPSTWQMYFTNAENPMNDVIMGPGVKIEMPKAIEFTLEQAKMIKDALDGVIPIEDLKKIRGIRVIRSL